MNIDNIKNKLLDHATQAKKAADSRVVLRRPVIVEWEREEFKPEGKGFSCSAFGRIAGPGNIWLKGLVGFDESNWLISFSKGGSDVKVCVSKVFEGDERSVSLIAASEVEMVKHSIETVVKVLDNW